MIYLFCFIISAGFAFFASRAENRKKFYILSFLSIAVMVVLAGFRDYTVGIDTYNYMTKPRYWDGAVSADSLWEYFKYYFPLGYGEPLFAVLVGVIAQFTGNFAVFLMVSHTIILTCTYVGIFRFRKHINPAFVLLAYYLLYYNHTLNLIRQHIAMAIIFAVLADILEKKYIRFCIFVFIAMLFHTTAIIAVGILAIYFIVNITHKKLINIGTTQRFYFTVLALTWLVFLFAPIINILVDMGLLNERYLFFINNNTDPALIASGVVIIELTAVFLFRKEIKDKCKDANFFILTSICYLILMQLSLTVAHGKRIALHFALADLITLGLIESSQKDPRRQKLVRIGIIGVCFVYWAYIYILKNAGETFPYILGV